MLPFIKDPQLCLLKPDVFVADGLLPMNSVCFAHHWLLNMRGGERVLEQMAVHFPDAPLFSLAAIPARLSPGLRQRRLVTPPFLQRPWAARRVRALLPWHPVLARSLSVPQDCRLLVSSDAGLIKCIPKPANARHLCYCHSPPRYLWDADVATAYTRGRGLTAGILRRLAPALLREDHGAAQRVDAFLCNSRFVAKRISECYGREARVVYPGVEMASFDPGKQREENYVVAGELTPYKRMDLAVEACNMLGRPLVVVGEGPELGRLQKLAGPTIRFAGRVTDCELRSLLETCRALLFPQIEDFGIVAVEAQAAGAPVVAFRGGGAVEIVEEDRTGVFFNEQTADALAGAIVQLEAGRIESGACAKSAARFSHEAFCRGFLSAVDSLGARPL